MSNAMRSGKRLLAGLAAGALGAGVMAFAAAPSASASTVAATIAWDNPSGVLVGEGLADDTRMNFMFSLYDSAGDETTNLSATQKVEIVVTNPTSVLDDSIAFGADDTVYTNAGTTQGGIADNFTRVKSGNTVTTTILPSTPTESNAGVYWGLGIYDDTSVLPKDNAAFADGQFTWGGAVASSRNGTYTLTARLINTVTNAVISSSTATFTLASDAGAPAATPLWASGPAWRTALNVDPLDVLGQTIGLNMDSTDDSPVIGLFDANGGPYVVSSGTYGNKMLYVTASGAVGDDSLTGGWNAPTLTGMTAVYSFSEIVPTWTSTGNTSMSVNVRPAGSASSTSVGSKSLTVSVAGAEDPGEVDAVLSNELAYRVSTDYYQVPVGTTSLTFAISTDTDTVDETTLQWNAWGVTDAGASVIVPSGGVSAQTSDEGSVTLTPAAGFGVDGDDLYFRAGTGATNDTVQVEFAVPVATIDTDPPISKVSTATTIPGTITDQFGQPLLGTWTVSLKTANSCTATSVATATAAADGSFTLDVPAAQAPTTADTETFYVCATNGFGSPTGPTASEVIYTATGGVGSLTVAPANTITGTTTSIRPLVQVPGTGTALLSSPTTSVWNPSTQTDVDDTAAVNGAGSALRLTATTDVTAAVTFSGSEGVLFSTRTIGGLATGSATETATPSASTTSTVSVLATKPGLHTVTATAGTSTATYTFYAKVSQLTGRVITAEPTAMSIGKNEFKPIKYKVTDIFGNAVPANTFAVTNAGGGFVSASSATTGAAGEAEIFYTAPDGTGTAQVTATGSTSQWVTSTSIAGAPDPVRSVNTTVTVTDKPVDTKTIVIVGERGTVKGKSGVIFEGTTTGFESGATVKPWIRFPGQTSYSEGSARPAISAAGDFTWQRKTGKKIYVYFTNDAGDVKSNRVIVAAK